MAETIEFTAGFNRKLNLPSENSELTALFLAAGTHQFLLPGYEVKEGYQFIKSGKKQQYRLVTTGGTPETVCLVELCLRNDIVAGQTSCTQIKVWRTTNDKHQSAVADPPRHFFRWLLDTYHIVVTDEEQTGDGRRFWEVMISWALAAGFYVYASDTHTHRLIVISKKEIK